MWIKSLNSILQLESTFPSEIPLLFTVCGIISDVQIVKQELGRLSSAPHQIRVLAVLVQFIELWGIGNAEHVLGAWKLVCLSPTFAYKLRLALQSPTLQKYYLYIQWYTY